MNTRKLLLGCAAVVAVAFIACIPSPTELCKSGVALQCDRSHECTPQTTKDSDIWKGIFGTDPADCKTKLEAAAKCAEKKEQDELCQNPDGGANGKYDLGKAAECSDGLKALSCADFNDPTKHPAACKARCTYQ